MVVRRARYWVALVTCVLVSLVVLQAGPASARTGRGQATVTGTQIPALPYFGSGEPDGSGTGTGGTPQGNARVAAACNDGQPLTGAQWHLLPPGSMGRVYARVDAPSYPRGVDLHPTGVALVDASTGDVVECGSTPVQTSTRRQLAVVGFYAQPFPPCDEPETCWQGSLRLYVGTTTGRAPANDRWQRADVISSLPATRTVDSSFADDDGPALRDYGTCQLSAIDPHQVATVWWRYTATTTGVVPVTVEVRNPWNQWSPYGPAFNPVVTVASLTADGPAPAPRADPDDCESPVVMEAGRTYLIAAYTFQDDYYDAVLVRGGPLTLRVGAVATAGVPTSTSVTSAGGRTTLAWAPPATSGASPVTGYRVSAQRLGPRGRWVTTASAGLRRDARSWAPRRLQPGVAYRLSVSAVNRAGSGPSAFAVTGRAGR